MRCCLRLAVAAVALIGCTVPRARNPDAVLAERQVRDQIAAWQAAAARRDAQALGALYANDATVHYPGIPEVRGRAAIERLWASIFQQATVTIVPGRVEISPSGDVAVEYGTYEVRDRSAETRVVDRGRYAFVWRLTGGAWLAWVDITTSDARPAPPSERE